MNITSFTITDVGYHYIGLRVLAALATDQREQQIATVSRNVLKYARDNALRLQLPEPRVNFETIGKKVCQELVHFEFAQLVRGGGYQLTAEGNRVLDLLNSKQYRLCERSVREVACTGRILRFAGRS